MWYPGICFLIFVALDLIDVGYGSSGAVPFLEMLKLLTLWFGISVPLVFIGAYFGYKQDVISFPVVTSNIPKQVKRSVIAFPPLFSLSGEVGFIASLLLLLLAALPWSSSSSSS